MNSSEASLKIKHIFKTGYIATIMIGLLVQVLSIRNARAIDIEEFSTPSGIKVHLVEDYVSPIITIAFSFLGGSSQDPVGKKGVSHMLSAMLEEGAGEDFQERLEELGAYIGFSVEFDYFNGNMRTLTQNADEAFALLGLALNKPGFDTRALERIRQVALVDLKRETTRPEAISWKAIREALFKNHPYRSIKKGDIENVRNLNRNDLQKIHRQLLTKNGLVISVVGAVDKKKLGSLIDTAFASLPETSDLKVIRDAKIDFGQNVKKQLDIPQSLVSFAFPGVTLSHPDFFAAYLVTHILGGIGFSPRLYKEVREKRGLTYSINSYMLIHRHAAFIAVHSATRSERVREAIDVIWSELQKMADHGPNEKELEEAKKYLIGSYAINNLDNSIEITKTLVLIQRENLGMDYIDRRANMINAVTLDDAKRVARELFGNKPTLVVVGPENI